MSLANTPRTDCGGAGCSGIISYHKRRVRIATIICWPVNLILRFTLATSIVVGEETIHPRIVARGDTYPIFTRDSIYSISPRAGWKTCTINSSCLHLLPRSQCYSGCRGDVALSMQFLRPRRYQYRVSICVSLNWCAKKDEISLIHSITSSSTVSSGARYESVANSICLLRGSIPDFAFVPAVASGLAKVKLFPHAHDRRAQNKTKHSNQNTTTNINVAVSVDDMLHQIDLSLYYIYVLFTAAGSTLSSFNAAQDPNLRTPVSKTYSQLGKSAPRRRSSFYSSSPDQICNPSQR